MTDQNQHRADEIVELTPEQESLWHAKVMELVKRHNLGFLHNPGGGQFLNRETGINIQVCNYDTKKDYETLLAGLRKLNLEPSETNQP